MIQATTQQGIFSTRPPRRAQPVRNRPEVVARSSEPAPRIPAEKKDCRWLEGVFNVVMLCVVAGVALAVSGAMARDFFDQLLRLDTFSLMRAFGSM